PIGINRKPDRSGAGLESRAMRTSSLSESGGSAAVGGLSGRAGSMPHAHRNAAATSGTALAPRCVSAATMRPTTGLENAMNRLIACLALAIGLAAPSLAYAGLDIGDRAPDFTAPAALGGKVHK